MAFRRAGAARRRALRWGARAEWWAALALMAKGYAILALRYSGGGGEVDLIARRGATIAFVEVKARPDLAAAAAAIGRMKEERFARAVRHWLVRNPAAAAGMTLRCDAVLVVPRRWPRHVPDAFGLPF